MELHLAARCSRRGINYAFLKLRPTYYKRPVIFKTTTGKKGHRNGRCTIFSQVRKKKLSFGIGNWKGTRRSGVHDNAGDSHRKSVAVRSLISIISRFLYAVSISSCIYSQVRNEGEGDGHWACIICEAWVKSLIAFFLPWVSVAETSPANKAKASNGSRQRSMDVRLFFFFSRWLWMCSRTHSLHTDTRTDFSFLSRIWLPSPYFSASPNELTMSAKARPRCCLQRSLVLIFGRFASVCATEKTCLRESQFPFDQKERKSQIHLFTVKQNTHIKESK